MKLRIFTTVIVLVFAVVPLSHAATFNCADSDTVCLIDAINTAYGIGEDDTINLQKGTYTLIGTDNETDGPNGLPSVTTAIEINGNDATIMRDESADSSRIWQARDLWSTHPVRFLVC